MAEPLRFHPLVADDLETAANWYDGISIELGNRFRASVDARFDTAELRPESFGMAESPLRAARVNRFPYLILFEHTETATEVAAFSTLHPIRTNGASENRDPRALNISPITCTQRLRHLRTI